MFKGILFDVDGVLLDSAVAHESLWTAWGELRELDVATLLAGINGERGTDTVRRVAPHLDPAYELEVLKRLWARHDAAVTAFANADQMLSALVPDSWGLVTSGTREAVLNRFAIQRLPPPSVLVCGEDVEHGKPHPEPYLTGASLLGLDPTECVVVEDAPAGVAAAKAAGCYVIAVTTSATEGELGAADEIHPDLFAVAGRLARLLSI